MEKTLGKSVFLVNCFLSCATFATPTITVTGTRTEPLSFRDWNYETYGVLGGGTASQVAGSEYSNYRASIAKKKARLNCKLENENSLKYTKDLALTEYKSNTSICDNYHILATISGVVGAVAAVPTFGFTAAAGVAGAASFATAGIICQHNADGRYAELNTHNEFVSKQFDLKVCDQIK